MNRRKFLGYAAVGLGAGLAGLRLVGPAVRSQVPQSRANRLNPDFNPDVDIRLT
ncbi:MAG TPA: twin-arginine translocation signal domain-containing protein, partial [Bacteroidetes bacterium]|nr:twin-arginine translocation signal domain-containing protein [Bacteroidota bacterium]